MTREGLPGARPAGPGPSGSRCPDAWRSPQPRARPRVLASPTAVAGSGRFSADGRRADVWPRVTVRERGREPGGWLWRPHAPARTRGPSERCLGAPAHTRCRGDRRRGPQRGRGAERRRHTAQACGCPRCHAGFGPQWTVATVDSGRLWPCNLLLDRLAEGPCGPSRPGWRVAPRGWHCAPPPARSRRHGAWAPELRGRGTQPPGPPRGGLRSALSVGRGL